MRDYTYLNGARFTINNLFRSQRFDIDRLDMSWVDGEKPEFTRGLRVVDNDEVNTITVAVQNIASAGTSIVNPAMAADISSMARTQILAQPSQAMAAQTGGNTAALMKLLA